MTELTKLLREYVEAMGVSDQPIQLGSEEEEPEEIGTSTSSPITDIAKGVVSELASVEAHNAPLFSRKRPKTSRKPTAAQQREKNEKLVKQLGQVSQQNDKVFLVVVIMSIILFAGLVVAFIFAIISLNLEDTVKILIGVGGGSSVIGSGLLIARFLGRIWREKCLIGCLVAILPELPPEESGKIISNLLQSAPLKE